MIKLKKIAIYEKKETSYKNGFSLIELMIAMFIGILMVAIAFFVFLSQSKTGRYNNALSSMQGDLIAVMDIFEQDVMNAGINLSNIPMSAVAWGTSGVRTLCIYSDADLNGTPEKIKYQYNNGKTRFQKRLANPATAAETVQPLLMNEPSFGFVYRDEQNTIITPTGTNWTNPQNGETLPSLSQYEAERVRTIEIWITAKSDIIDPDTGQRSKRSMRRIIKMRNR